MKKIKIRGFHTEVNKVFKLDNGTILVSANDNLRTITINKIQNANSTFVKTIIFLKILEFIKHWSETVFNNEKEKKLWLEKVQAIIMDEYNDNNKENKESKQSKEEMKVINKIINMRNKESNSYRTNSKTITSKVINGTKSHYSNKFKKESKDTTQYCIKFTKVINRKYYSRFYLYGIGLKIKNNKITIIDAGFDRHKED